MKRLGVWATGLIGFAPPLMAVLASLAPAIGGFAARGERQHVRPCGKARAARRKLHPNRLTLSRRVRRAHRRAARK
jgi:hypothetical protein